MVAHAAFPNVGLQEHDQSGKLLPSSLSPAIISKLLRGELGFEGLVLTDDLEMGAIVENYGIGEACVMAIDAGVDMLAICASSEAIRKGFGAVAEAVRSGRISEDRVDRSIERISSLRTSLQDPLPFDDDELDALSNDIAEMNTRLE
jgi:beta-N-acetylhexosaminidase